MRASRDGGRRSSTGTLRTKEAEERFYAAERRIHIGVTPKAVPAEAAVAHRRPTG